MNTYRIVNKYTGRLLVVIEATSKRSAMLKANKVKSIYTGSFYVYEIRDAINL